jgi:NADP-dependent 3-hydroxy acid dehydrogenase YdfG
MTVLITGASSGIGEACAHAFAGARSNLILVSRRLDRLKTLASELSHKHGVRVDTFQLDVRNRKAIERLLESQSQLIKSVDVLVNNAGLAKGLVPIQAGDPDDWDVMIDTNIKGLLYMTRALLPQMIAEKKGHIINLGSVAGHWSYEKGNVYSATKFAVRALTESLRLDLRGTGVRVTEISPGMVETEFSEVRLNSKELGNAVYAGKTPLQARDIAETVLWCAQRPAHVNIQELVIFPTEQAGVHPAAPVVSKV